MKHSDKLCVPLATLIDYRGHRIIALSKLPIRGCVSLCYGSDDGGVTVQNSNFEVDKLMEMMGKESNLAPHICGNVEKQRIFGPTDLEIHTSNDGRFYALDTARLFPPTCPSYNFKTFKILPEKNLNDQFSITDLPGIRCNRSLKFSQI